MLLHNSHWMDVASFVGLVLVVVLAISVLIWPHSAVQAADSFADMLKGLQLVLRGLSPGF